MQNALDTICIFYKLKGHCGPRKYALDRGILRQQTDFISIKSSKPSLMVKTWKYMFD